MKKAANIILAILLYFSVMVWIITLSIGLPIYIRPFYYAQIEPLGLPEKTGHTAEEIRAAYDEVMDYLTLPGREFGTGVFEFSERGRAHFVDCRVLFTVNLFGFLICSAWIAVIYAAARKKYISLPKLGGLGISFWSGSTLLLLFSMVGIWAAVDFSHLFDRFHKVFFAGKTNWLFRPSEDGIIRALPMDFFLNCVILIGCSAALCSLALVIIGVLKKRHIKGM